MITAVKREATIRARDVDMAVKKNKRKNAIIEETREEEVLGRSAGTDQIGDKKKKMVIIQSK